VSEDRNLRERIEGGSGKDKKPFGVTALEGVENYVRNQLHVKQYIDPAPNSFNSHFHPDPTRIHLLLVIRTSPLEEDTVYRPAPKLDE